MKFIEFLFDKINELLELSRSYRLAKHRCENCERLERLLEAERREKKVILDHIVDVKRYDLQMDQAISESEELKPISLPRTLSQRRALAAQESYKKAHPTLNS